MRRPKRLVPLYGHFQPATLELELDTGRERPEADVSHVIAFHFEAQCDMVVKAKFEAGTPERIVPCAGS
jgi:hypothetical protein